MTTAKENTKKYICENNNSFAYYSGFGGIELKHIEYGIEDYIYYTSNTWYGKPNYHKCKVYTDSNGNSYFKVYDSKIPLDECIRM